MLKVSSCLSTRLFSKSRTVSSDISATSLSSTASRLLAALPILQGSKEATLTELTRSATQLRVPKRTVLYDPTDECTGLYVIVAGEIKLTGSQTSGREKVLALLGRADWFGETALFLRQQHTSGAKTADKATTLIHLPRWLVLDCLSRDHAFVLRFLAATCERLRLSMCDAERVTLCARSRVIAFLLDQARARFTSGPVTVTLGVPKRAIASRLNLTPEHLSRLFRELADARMIDIDGRYVLIHDLARLRQETARELTAGSEANGHATNSANRVSRSSALKRSPRQARESAKRG
jgi:CRP/FNR family transcriptional regulator, dissimilatory nitrate respiration regulator